MESRRSAPLEAFLLGGVGEFGMNMMALRSDATTFLIDAGVMFPDPDHFGVDLIIPDIEALHAEVGRISALVLTHGHEDHIGAVPYVWNLIDGPVYGTPLTLALVERKLSAHGIDVGDRLIGVTPRSRVAIGDMEVEFVRVAHSIPDAVALAVHASVGTVIHTGDFKFDRHPLDDRPTDTDRLAELGRDGVVALFSDSTNATQAGHTGSELDVRPALEELFASAPGRLFVATFASSLHRIQLLLDLAEHFGRQVAFVGRGISRNVEIAERLGYLRIPSGLRIGETDIARRPPSTVLCIVTGSQGEPLAALSRIAVGAHRHVTVDPGDVVVFSARPIPGNQRAISRLMNHLVRRGARVVDNGATPVHVSGHGSEEELKRMLFLVRPRYLVPIHGEYRYLAHHAELAERVTGGDTTPLLAENGDRVCFDGVHGWVGEPVRAGRVLIDGTRTGEVADEVLRDRRHLASDGIVVAVMALDAHTGRMEDGPTVITRGFVVDDRTESLLETVPDLLRTIAREATTEERADHGVMSERMRVELQRILRKRSGRRPMVLPVIMEI